MIGFQGTSMNAQMLCRTFSVSRTRSSYRTSRYQWSSWTWLRAWLILETHQPATSWIELGPNQRSLIDRATSRPSRIKWMNRDGRDVALSIKDLWFGPN